MEDTSEGGVSGYLTVEEMLSIPYYSDLAVAPSGAQVAYVANGANWDENRYVGHIHVVSRETGSDVALTRGTRGSSAPAYCHYNGHPALAYLRALEGGDRDESLQVHLTPVGGGEGIALTAEKKGVRCFRLSPDGRQLYYIAAREPSPGRKRRDKLFPDVDYADYDDVLDTLYVLPVERAVARAEAPWKRPADLREGGLRDEGQEESQLALPLLADAALHVVSFDVAADGTRLVFDAVPSPNPEDAHRRRLYLVTLDTGVCEPLTLDETLDGQPQFSPDGHHICYGRMLGEGRSFDLTTLEVMDLRTRVVTRPLLAVDEDVLVVAWTEKGIVWEWQDGMNRRIELLHPDLQTRETLVAVKDGSAQRTAVTPDGQHVAYVQATADTPFDVFLDGLKLTDRGAHYRGHRQSCKRAVTWRSQDGQRIEGVLSLPDDYKEDRRYPLLVVIHGGPVGVSIPVPTSSRYYPVESFVEQGFVVLEPNYRGSAGYGAEFRRLNYRQLGIGDYADVISGVDHLIGEGMVEPNQVGVMGWSQGGYISAFCTTYSDRFRAVSVGAGISNWLTYYVNTDIHPFTRHYLGETPWLDPGIYAQTSPMTYIGQACTPTLIQHGDADRRVPVPNAFELYQGLRDSGVETKLVLYRGMGHGSTRPAWNRAIMRQNLAWFTHYLLNHPLQDFWLSPAEGVPT
ncbi:MAG: S9 family peptidase [Firmicutes bacterium]|nr:S9 family peptidase [Bacillota bacterium]